MAFFNYCPYVIPFIRYFSEENAEHSCGLRRSGLLLGGALGNAIDRTFAGAVTDFFDFRIWPVFNVADIGIVVGVALLLWYSWTHLSDK